MGTENDNGARGQEVQPHLVITVTDKDIFKLTVEGMFPTLDYALNMLDQARRELESQWRIQRAQQMMQQTADQQLVRDLSRHR